jgi:uncharacterized protein (DUF1015 family)
VIHVRPFAALRPPANRASEVSCPPYDVVDREGALAAAQGRECSFMRVVRPDIDFPETPHPSEAQLASRAQANLAALVSSGALVQDTAAQLYVYRMARAGRRVAGLVCCVDVADYRTGAIRRHEHTRPDKEADRVRHIVATGAHSEPVLLAVPRVDELPRQLLRDMNDRPLVHFSARDGVTHSLWAVHDPAPYISMFGGVDRVYIADGHHRSSAADRAEREWSAQGLPFEGLGPSAFPAVIFPAEELVILPYHRLARHLAGMSPSEFRERCERTGVTWRRLSDGENALPDLRGEVGVRLHDGWWRAVLPAHAGSPLERLDVSRLSAAILAPALGIVDERTDPGISFLGGVGPERLDAEVESGRAAAAFAMRATDISDLMAIADREEVMPPKSTWFDPKIRSGLFLHRFATAGHAGANSPGSLP